MVRWLYKTTINYIGARGGCGYSSGIGVCYQMERFSMSYGLYYKEFLGQGSSLREPYEWYF